MMIGPKRHKPEVSIIGNQMYYEIPGGGPGGETQFVAIQWDDPTKFSVLTKDQIEDAGVGKMYEPYFAARGIGIDVKVRTRRQQLAPMGRRRSGGM